MNNNKTRATPQENECSINIHQTIKLKILRPESKLMHHSPKRLCTSVTNCITGEICNLELIILFFHT